MIKYHKINSIYKRDEKTKRFIIGKFSEPEFEYLFNNDWVFTEKVDGTNVRVNWDGKKVTFGGRTDNAQMPVRLIQRLQELFSDEIMGQAYPDINSEVNMILFGEGYGAKIQKGGKYISDNVDFVLFDVLVDRWWLQRDDVNKIADTLNIKSVPIVGVGPLSKGISMCMNGLKSTWGDFQAEGIVARPKVELKARSGSRIITKIKCKDFN